MADPKDSVLDKAESFARRILERIGSKVDKKIAPAEEPSLSSSKIGSLASRLEHLIDSSLKEDERGTSRVAPNRFKVLFTYEETSKLSPQYIEAVGKELTATVFEYIHNRRYVTRGAIALEAGQDLFARATTVRASFDSEEDRPLSAEQAGARTTTDGSKSVCFNSTDGRSYRVELKPEGAPAYIGRAAGNAVRMDDPSVSRLHCSLSLRCAGHVVIADVGSANGTFVNEQLLGSDEARALNAGDVVGVGDFKLTVSEIA